MNIAYVTYQDKGTYTVETVENEDKKLLDFLKSKGLKIEMVIWNDSQVNWEDYDLAILKSPWDYFDLIHDFYSWLDYLKLKKVRLINPIDIVKWNADKHYLQEIENAGLKVTPTAFISKNIAIDLSPYFINFNTDKLIVKPCVSGGSKNTFKVTSQNKEEITLKLKSLIQEEDFIVQPFIKEIEENGEWSFLFFNGKFSHALLKKAKAGDFRVQHSLGGTIHPVQASEEQIISAGQYVYQFAKGCLYARVDGTFINNSFVLMELELIEPFLFLDTDKSAYENYYQALMQLI